MTLDPQTAVKGLKKKRAELAMRIGKREMLYWSFIAACGDIYLHFGMKKLADKMFKKMRRSPVIANALSSVPYPNTFATYLLISNSLHLSKKYFFTLGKIQRASNQGVHFIWIVQGRSTLPDDGTFLEILTETSPGKNEFNRQECQLSPSQFPQNDGRLFMTLSISSPPIDPGLLKVGDRLELVIRVFDLSKTRLLGEHHQFHEYILTRRDLDVKFGGEKDLPTSSPWQ